MAAKLTHAQVQHELDETRASLPIVDQLGELFEDPKMFGSFRRFGEAGFRLVDHPPHKIMIGRHKRAKGYLFKKYNNDKDDDDQLRNYMHRIEGARCMRTFIAERGFTSVVAPKKWLYELPSRFPSRYLLVVEKMDIVPALDNVRRYARIKEDQLRELATMLYYFRGLNSWIANLPYTDEGQIAFIDTERWHHDKELLRKIGDSLPFNQKTEARAVFKDLKKQGAVPFTSTFK
jgi:hypothetical protein